MVRGIILSRSRIGVRPKSARMGSPDVLLMGSNVTYLADGLRELRERV